MPKIKHEDGDRLYVENWDGESMRLSIWDHGGNKTFAFFNLQDVIDLIQNEAKNAD